MLLDAWRLAVGTLTALPVSPPKVVDRQRAGLAMVLAPVAVLPLGLGSGLLVVLGHELGLSIFVIPVLVLGLVVLGNRGLHLDGLSDTADGLAASYDAERSLAVMKSGTSGPAGVVATVLVLGLQTAGLLSLLTLPYSWGMAVLVALVICLSRAALVLCCLRGVPAARADGLGSTFTGTIGPAAATGIWIVGALLLSAVAGWAGLDWWRGAVAALVAVVVVGLLVVRAVKRFGGVTGDVFGASVEVALAAMLVSLS